LNRTAKYEWCSIKSRVQIQDLIVDVIEVYTLASWEAFMSQGDVKSEKPWKEIAARVAAEEDGGKILDLANELIEALDEDSSKVLGQSHSESDKSAA
jgi:hypothetical protein